MVPLLCRAPRRQTADQNYVSAYLSRHPARCLRRRLQSFVLGQPVARQRRSLPQCS